MHRFCGKQPENRCTGNGLVLVQQAACCKGVTPIVLTFSCSQLVMHALELAAMLQATYSQAAPKLSF